MGKKKRNLGEFLSNLSQGLVRIHVVTQGYITCLRYLNVKKEEIAENCFQNNFVYTQVVKVVCGIETSSRPTDCKVSNSYR